MVKRSFMFIIVSLVAFGAVSFGTAQEARANDETTSEESEAYWDYGIGLGAIRYEQYPASNEFSYLAVPSPTFQYRGKVLRADDRDGAHIYLFKREQLTIEISGEGTPALESSNSKARAGMDDLPWMVALGPQLVWRESDSLSFGFGLFQATTTDFSMTRFAGQIYEARATYQFGFPFESYGPFFEPGFSNAKIRLSLQGGSKEYQSIYFDVPAVNATADRPAYDAQDGFLNYSLSYYQTFKSGKFSINFGGSVHSYDLAVNRDSPLHKSDHNVTAFVGLNYILGGSSKPAVPESETSGVINNLQKNRQLRNSL